MEQSPDRNEEVGDSGSQVGGQLDLRTRIQQLVPQLNSSDCDHIANVLDEFDWDEMEVPPSDQDIAQQAWEDWDATIVQEEELYDEAFINCCYPQGIPDMTFCKGNRLLAPPACMPEWDDNGNLRLSSPLEGMPPTLRLMTWNTQKGIRDDATDFDLLCQNQCSAMRSLL